MTQTKLEIVSGSEPLLNVGVLVSLVKLEILENIVLVSLPVVLVEVELVVVVAVVGFVLVVVSLATEVRSSSVKVLR